MPDITWRDYLLGNLNELFNPDDQVHGFEHAQNVEARVLNIISEPEISPKSIDPRVIRAAALLHDIGYIRENKNWSTGKVEHVVSSINIARSLLLKISPFKEESILIDSVCYLILHHDDTNYSFPIINNGIGTISNPDTPLELQNTLDQCLENNPDLKIMLNVLKQADSQEGSSTKGAERTWWYSIGRGLPYFARGNPTGSLAWEDSSITNVKLAAKRAILDSYTINGRRLAEEYYRETEIFVKEICERNNHEYTPEPLIKVWGVEKIHSYEESEKHIMEYKNWEQLDNIIRSVPLMGDPRLLPYARADIRSELIPISKLVPLAKYAIKEKIEFQKNLAAHLFSNYAVDLFNLSGIISFKGDEKHPLAPPVVEQYFENDIDPPSEVYALVDGMHRCIAASKLGLTHIRVILIKGVPSAYPLCPLPVHWGHVKYVSETPPLDEKRKFRFNKIEDIVNLIHEFPNIYEGTVVPPSIKKAKYFTYRNFEKLGSLGIR